MILPFLFFIKKYDIIYIVNKEINAMTIRELIDKLNYYTELYDKGTPSISDREWDDLYFKLVKKEEETKVIFPDSPTQKIYYEVKNKLDKVEHNHDMLSLAKTKSIEEVESFVKDKPYIAMEKLDGLTCSLRYLDGRLVSAETRGNGYIGEDVLHTIRTMRSVPKVISYKDELIVDGEVICPINVFERDFADKYKNPRNYAAGALRRLDARENESSGLVFIAWDVIKGFDDEKLLSRKLDRLSDFNFTPVSYSSIGAKKILEDIEKIQASAEMKNRPIDGVVFKYDEIEYYQSLGATAHHPVGGLAYKFYDETYTTTLRNIAYKTSRNGTLTPVAIFDEIDIDGTIVSRASLHNISIMEEVLGEKPYVGQPIEVIKSNMIIPQVVSAKKLEELDD